MHRLPLVAALLLLASTARALVAGLCCVAAAGLAAQSGSSTRVTLLVKDAVDSGAVSGAQVSVDAKGVGRTDGLGALRLKMEAGSHDVRVTMLGYKPVDAPLPVADTAMQQVVYLERVPQLLSQMTVHGRSMRVPAGFERVYQRARMQDGTFITREHIDSVGAPLLPSLLHSETNIRVSSRGPITAPRCARIEVWLDGILLQSDSVAQDHVAHLNTTMVQAVEVYLGQSRVPREFLTVRFNRPPTCGVIAIWTRRR